MDINSGIMGKNMAAILHAKWMSNGILGRQAGNGCYWQICLQGMTALAIILDTTIFLPVNISRQGPDLNLIGISWSLVFFIHCLFEARSLFLCKTIQCLNNTKEETLILEKREKMLVTSIFSFFPHILHFNRQFLSFNPLPHMPILESSNSATNKDMMSKIWTNWETIIWLSSKHCGKRRNCSLPAISPFSTMFSKAVSCWCIKMSIYGVKG